MENLIRRIARLFCGHGEYVLGLEEKMAIMEAHLKPVPPPKIVGEITAAEVRAKILEVFPQVEILELADRKYKLTTVAEMNRFLAKDDTDKFTWQQQWPDCDDFTRRLLGNLTIPGWWALPKGDCWVFFPSGGGHSILITLLYELETDTEPNVYLIEGQTDAIELAPEMFEEITVKLIKL